MKLFGNLIVTLCDFARFFDLDEFWQQRHSFKRDMGPDKIFYWTDGQKHAFYGLCHWIDACDNGTADDIATLDAHNALEVLARRDVDMAALSRCAQSTQTDIDSEIVAAYAPGDLRLPASRDLAEPISLRKIVVKGHPDSRLNVLIGDKTVETLRPGQIAYATSCTDGFFEVFRGEQQNHRYEAWLIDNAGEMSSTLLVKDKRNGQTTRINNVYGFTLTADGYVYIDYTHSIVGVGADFELKFLVARNYPDSRLTPAIPVALATTKSGECRALYSCGTMYSTASLKPALSNTILS